MARTRWKSKGRQESGTFMAVPTVVLDSANFRALSTKAKALILDIGARFNGYNNGDLAAPWSWMKLRGWRSKDTLQRAVTELQEAGIIELTRQGGLMGASLYAFTWLPIAPCKGKLDVAPTGRASNKWKAVPAIGAVKNKTPPRPSGRSGLNAGCRVTENRHAAPNIGSMRAQRSKLPPRPAGPYKNLPSEAG